MLRPELRVSTKLTALTILSPNRLLTDNNHLLFEFYAT
jgi:hypothetical protein